MDAGNPAAKRPSYPKWLLFAFALFWAAVALKLSYFQNWLLENVLTVAFVGLLVWTYRRFPLSNISYTLIFGRGLNEMMGWRRNHYYRFVHFCFGLLLSYPIREIFCRVAGARGFWGYYLPLDVTMSFSMLYELIEWGAAAKFGGDLGQAYLGTQGDEWDAHRDMALASLGALIAMCVTAAINWRLQRDFARE